MPDAADRLDKLLHDGARELLRQGLEPPTAFISTGITGQILLSVLAAEAEDPVHTYGWAYTDDGVAAIEDAVSGLETVFHPVNLDPRLPTREAVWEHEEPSVLLFYLSLRRLSERTGVASAFTEQAYTTVFARHLRNVEFMQRLAPLRPAARLLSRSRIDRVLQRFVPAAGKGIDILASPYRSAIITNDHTLRRQDTNRLVAERLPDGPDPEAVLDEEHDLAGKDRNEIFPYLQFRVREGGYWLPLQWQAIRHLDLFSYQPVMEHVLRHRPSTRRRLVTALARRYGVSAPVEHSWPRGWGETVIRPAFEHGWGRYADTVDDFMDRGLVEDAADILLPDRLSRCTNDHLEYMASIYLLEQWLSVYIDSERPGMPFTP